MQEVMVQEVTVSNPRRDEEGRRGSRGGVRNGSPNDLRTGARGGERGDVRSGPRTGPRTGSRTGPRTGPRTGSYTGSRGGAQSRERFWLWGIHSVLAALRNPGRRCYRVLCTSALQERVVPLCEARLNKLAGKITGEVACEVAYEVVTREEIDRILAPLSPHAVHQGVAVEVAPLPRVFLETFLAQNSGAQRLAVLDQVTDPQNFGAILRNACAFGVEGVLLTERHAPPLEGVVGKSASGALEQVPLVLMSNLAQGLRVLKKAGFWCFGFSEEGAEGLADVRAPGPKALVFGAEGRGLRRLTTELCDAHVRLPTVPGFPTLNVSAATAVAFYELSQSSCKDFPPA